MTIRNILKISSVNWINRQLNMIKNFTVKIIFLIKGITSVEDYCFDETNRIC